MPAVSGEDLVWTVVLRFTVGDKEQMKRAKQLMDLKPADQTQYVPPTDYNGNVKCAVLVCGSLGASPNTPTQHFS